MNLMKNLGLKLAAIWLILHGLVVFVPALAFNGFAFVTAILAIAAGVLILMDR